VYTVYTPRLVWPGHQAGRRRLVEERFASPVLVDQRLDVYRCLRA
jgi:hypothetical protein